MLLYSLSQYGSFYLLVLGALAIGIMIFMQKGIWGSLAERTGLQLFPTRRLLVRNL
jgi:branched-chain amino acid transport system permease protein